MQMQSTYWLEKVLKMISSYVSALLCTLQHIVIHTLQLSGVNSPKCFAFSFVLMIRRPPRPTPKLTYEMAVRFFLCHSVYTGPSFFITDNKKMHLEAHSSV
jgi:hypothetical protein